MAKLTGTDPRKGRKTLGQAMQELIDANQVDEASKVAHAANHGPSGKDSQVAKGVMGRNTYPNETNSLKSSANITPYTDGRELNQGLVDIAPAGLKAVQDVARDVMSEYNDYIPNEVHGESTGGRRGDHLQSAQTNEAETFIQKLKDLGPIQQDLAAVNFDLLSGGGASDGKGLSSLLKNQGGFFTAKQIQDIIDKIGAGSSDTKKSLVLAAVNGENGTVPNARPNGVIAGNVHDVLEAANRYSPSEKSPYIKDPSSDNEDTFFKDGLYSIQVGSGRLGVYDKDGKGIKTIDLSRMAMQLMVQAQSHGDLAGMIDEGFAKGEAGGGSFLFDLAALVPGLTQIGAARISQNLMRISHTDHAGSLFDRRPGAQDDLFNVQSGNVTLGAGPSSKTPGQIDPRSAGSYGQMNSFVEPFDGPMPFGMFFITLYSILGVLLLAIVIDVILKTTNFGPAKGTSANNAASPSSLQLGFNSRGGGGDDVASLFFKLFGLPRLDFNFASCLLRGLERFYDIPSILDLITGAAGFEEVLESAVNLALAPGYYATITKQVLRDFEQITEAILAVGINASVFNVIAGIFKVVEVLFSSFTFRFIVFLMKIGNIDLLSRKNFGIISTGELIAPVDDKQKDKNAAIAATPFSRMRLSRFNGKANPLSLRYHPALYTHPAYAIQNPSLADDTTNIKPEDEPVKAKTIAGDLSKARLVSMGKPSKAQLRELEDALDVEYMPFYLHDLRTDEVFSMPAFISGFSEDFAPEYNETHGFGRTDPVLIYSKTRRNMSIDFKLVSFSPADHDYMWFVINKLTAMCYPQRSAGQKRVFDDGSKFFIQPFSQVPTASPLIRLRLGELFKSNYSKVALARLFGLLGAPGRATIAGGADDSAGKTMAQLVASAETETLFAASKALSEGDLPAQDFFVNPGMELKVSNGQSTVTAKVLVNAGPEDETNPQEGVKFKVGKTKLSKSKNEKGRPVWIFKSEIASKGFFDSEGDVKKNLLPLGSAALKQLFPDEDVLPPDFSVTPTITITAELQVVSHRASDALLHEITLDRKQVREEAIKSASASAALDPSTDDNVNFMKAENNPIVASFEASRGRGLAGFITALTFDYAEVPWDTRPGSRAPMSVNVSMTFAPVHDLPLGMDADGSLIAPSHPVGRFAMTDPYNEMATNESNTQPRNDLKATITKSFNDSIASRKNVNVD